MCVTFPAPSLSLLQVAEKRMVEVSRPGVGPLVGVFLGLVGSFLSLLLLAVSITLARSYRYGTVVCLCSILDEINLGLMVLHEREENYIRFKSKPHSVLSM